MQLFPVPCPIAPNVYANLVSTNSFAQIPYHISRKSTSYSIARAIAAPPKTHPAPCEIAAAAPVLTPSDPESVVVAATSAPDMLASAPASAFVPNVCVASEPDPVVDSEAIRFALAARAVTVMGM